MEMSCPSTSMSSLEIVSPSPPPPQIIAFGNVLLDFSVKIDNTEIPDRFGLTLDTQGEISSEDLLKIQNEIQSKYKIIYNAGGSVLNTCRILKSLNGPETLYFGAIGNDRNAEILKEILQNSGIRTCLQTIENYPTGQCICFIYGDKTGLYANIGASIKFDEIFLKSCEKNFLLPSPSPQIFYVEGYFVTQRYDLCEFIYKNYVDGKHPNKLLAFNLNSSYIVKEHYQIVNYFIKNSTLLFGNYHEYETLINVMKLNSIDDFAKSLLLNQPSPLSPKNQKIIIITNGCNDIIVYINYNQHQNQKFSLSNNGWKRIFHVPKVPDEEILDTTGAGDSFVAGFLNVFLRDDATLDACIEEGCRVANLVIRHIGCKI